MILRFSLLFLLLSLLDRGRAESILLDKDNADSHNSHIPADSISGSGAEPTKPISITVADPGPEFLTTTDSKSSTTGSLIVLDSEADPPISGDLGPDKAGFVDMSDRVSNISESGTTKNPKSEGSETLILSQRSESVHSESLTASQSSLLELVRIQRSAAYQSNYVGARFYAPVHNGDRMPKNAVKPFGRPLRFDGKIEDMAVALWIPDSDKMGVWGRAWEDKGQIQAVFIHNRTVKTNRHPDLAKGFRVLIYPGTMQQNGFRFSWVKVGDVDMGTVLYSGLNKHVPAVYVESDEYEFLGDSDWERREMEYVVYGSNDPHTVASYGRHSMFEDDVYVLTKQRCNCAC